MRLFILLISLFFYAQQASALNFNDFMNRLGSFQPKTNGQLGTKTYNLMGGGVYHTMGSFSTRFNAPQGIADLFSYTAPSFKAGCNGIDLDTGGLFYIKDPQILVDRMQSYGTSVAYGVIVGLVSSVPVIGHTFKWLQDQLQALNTTLRNGCEAGQKLGQSAYKAIAAKFTNDSQEAAQQQGTPAGEAVDNAQALPVHSENIVVTALTGRTFGDAEFLMDLIGYYTIVRDNANPTGAKPKTGESLYSIGDLMKPENIQDPTKLKTYTCDTYGGGNSSSQIQKLTNSPNSNTKVDGECLNPTVGAMQTNLWSDKKQEAANYVRAELLRVRHANTGANNPSDWLKTKWNGLGLTGRALLGNGKTEADLDAFFASANSSDVVQVIRVIGKKAGLDPVTPDGAASLDPFVSVISTILTFDLVSSDLDRAVGTINVGLATEIPSDVQRTLLSRVQTVKDDLRQAKRSFLEELQQNKNISDIVKKLVAG